ncbi:MAG: type II toxin-antitoxin system RelE/ParE family toxin [Firmicutes bacterium]|jgi:mRNA interferase RelE/StbE|nr:type II toxin-antitoxin system RelE/ParE family toxin [Bacillota bacterium]
MNVIITERAARYLDKLDKKAHQKLERALHKLCDFPEVTNVKRLRGRPGKYRLRVGDWRIIFAVDWKRDTLVVITIVHRKDAYK